MNVATTIEHLGGARIFGIAFAHHFEIGGGACFAIAPALRRKLPAYASHVRIRLTAMDTYDVEVSWEPKNARIQREVLGYVEGVHADQLKSTVENLTGLRLSL